MAGRLGLGGCHEGEVLDHLLGVLGLAGARLAGAEDALVLTVCNKVVRLASHNKESSFVISIKQNQMYSLLINENSNILI